MHVEHRFVTTAPAAETFTTIARTLNSLGFRIDHEDGSGLKASKGLNKAAKAKSVSELPQSVKVNFDRGRVELAVGAELKGKTGGHLPEHQALLVAQIIEADLTSESEAARLRSAWQDLEIQIWEHRDRQARKRTMAWLGVIGLIVFVIVAIVAAAVVFAP